MIIETNDKLLYVEDMMNQYERPHVYDRYGRVDTGKTFDLLVVRNSTDLLTFDPFLAERAILVVDVIDRSHLTYVVGQDHRYLWEIIDGPYGTAILKLLGW